VLGKEMKGKRSDGSFGFSPLPVEKAKRRKPAFCLCLILPKGAPSSSTNLQYLNTHDQLTGLFNRSILLQVMNERIQSNEQQRKFALVF
jgi:GGDEF domain-containing protein